MKRFWCQELDEAARLCRAQYPTQAELWISIADDVCDNRFLFRDHWEMERTNEPVCFQDQIDWAHIPADDAEWLYAMNRHTSFVNLGKAWRLTHKPCYAEAFTRLIADWIDRVPLTPQSEGNTWRSLEAGLRCESWLRALCLFSDYDISAALRKKIDDSLRVHADYLMRASGAFHMLSNWGVLQDHGLFLLGVYFDEPRYRTCALERLDGNLHRSVMRDGTHWEQSPMYHCEVLHCAADTLLIARQNGLCVPARFEENVKKMFTALAAWVKPNGELLCQSDSDAVDARDMLAQGALLFQSGALKRAAGETPAAEILWDFGTQGIAEYAALAADTCAPHSVALTDSGNYMLRGETCWVHMHCGCLGSGHGHADLLHVDAGVNGEDILRDCGRYTYVNTPLRRALKLPAAHNTTRVDGEDFSECVDSWGYSRLAEPLKGEHCFTPEADFVSGMHMGYLARGVLTQRKLVLLKKLNALVIFDQFYAQGAHSYEQFFHFGAGECALNGQTLQWRGNNAEAQLLCLGEGLTCTLQTTPCSREYNALESCDKLTVTRNGDGFASFVSVLFMQEGAFAGATLSAQLLPVQKYIAGTPLQSAQAQAVRVEKNGEACTVLACHAEVISEVDMLSAGGYAGYGKLLVFSDSAPDGVCLAW